MKLKFQTQCLLLLSIAFGLESIAADSCSDEMEEARDISLDQLVNMASYVGMYHVQSAAIVSETAEGQSEQLYRYELLLTKHLLGDRVHKISVLGLEPYSQVPQYYFAIMDHHNIFSSENPNSYGTTVAVKKDSDNSCVFAPKMMIGYSYLVLGNTNSQASYEMIPITELDNWYRQVEKASQQVSARMAE